MTDEKYNGWANKETWALNLHLMNDEGLYNMTLDRARDILDHTVTDYDLGGEIVDFWRETVREAESEGTLSAGLRVMRDEVGSWWRINYEEIGASVKEALDL